MKSEMGYRFKGSGFNAPEEKRKYEQKRESLQAFADWLGRVKNTDDFLNENKNVEQLYKSAEILLVNNKITVDEVHGLIIILEDNQNIEASGLFASAVYNNAPDEEIVFDLQVPLFGLGYRLNEGKVLVNKAHVTGCFGQLAKGQLINLGESEYLPGWQTGNVLINYGELSSPLSNGKGLYLDYENVLQFELKTADKRKFGGTVDVRSFDSKGVFIDRNKLAVFGLKTDFIGLPKICYVRKKDSRWKKIATPLKIRKYQADLQAKLEPGRYDYHDAIEILKDFGPRPAESIKKDLGQLLKEAGHEI